MPYRELVTLENSKWFKNRFGKSKEELKEVLEKINREHYQLNAKYGSIDEYKDTPLNEMIEMFAEDDFYSGHFVALKYLREIKLDPERVA